MSDHLEVEVMFVAKISNLDDLEKAQSIEEQEQYDLWSLDKDLKNRLGKVRVRRSRFKGQEESTFKLYSKMNKSSGVQEESIETTITKETFDIFKKSRQGNGLWKFRYRFPITNFDKLPNSLKDADLFWEVDAFPLDKEGNLDPWIKIDLELPADTPERIEDLKKIESLPRLPFKVDRLYSQLDNKHKKEISECFNRWESVLSNIYKEELEEDSIEESLESFGYLGQLNKRNTL